MSNSYKDFAKLKGYTIMEYSLDLKELYLEVEGLIPNLNKFINPKNQYITK